MRKWWNKLKNWWLKAQLNQGLKAIHSLTHTRTQDLTRTSDYTGDQSLMDFLQHPRQTLQSSVTLNWWSLVSNYLVLAWIIANRQLYKQCFLQRCEDTRRSKKRSLLKKGHFARMCKRRLLNIGAASSAWVSHCQLWRSKGYSLRFFTGGWTAYEWPPAFGIWSARRPAFGIWNRSW